MSPSYYQPSHKMPPGGIALFLVGGLLAAAVLAVVYVYADWYIPFIYLNIFICLGFGLGLGFALASLTRQGKLRSPGGVAGLALLVSGAAVYLQWAVYLMLVANMDGDSTSFNASLLGRVVTDPAGMASLMSRLNETGTWSIKKTTPSGIWLALIWLAEAAIIVGGAVWLARNQAAEPFSETANEWADEEKMPQYAAYAADPAAARQALESGRFDGLTPYLPQAGADQYARLSLHGAPNDPNCRYLTLENIQRTLDKKGKETEATTAVVRHLALSPTAYAELKKRFGPA